MGSCLAKINPARREIISIPEFDLRESLLSEVVFHCDENTPPEDDPLFFTAEYMLYTDDIDNK